MRYTDRSDETLVALTREGVAEAYEALVIRYERAVKGTAFKLTGDSYTAEDAAQDAFVTAWLRLETLREPARFGPWVCAIAKNHARRLAARARAGQADVSLHELENLDLTGEVHHGLTEPDSVALREAVDALGDTLRETVRLYYFEGLSVKTIAARLGGAEGTVKWRLSEGRNQLRKEFGIMENNRNEQETLADRVMQAVSAWEKETRAAREGYIREVAERAVLVDVRPVVHRAAALAETKRERRHSAIAAEVMERIMATDPQINPAYTEKGRWNFFEYDKITREDGRIRLTDDRTFSFEWKELWNCADPHHPIGYSFFDAYLYEGLGYIWSDEWVPGYAAEHLSGLFEDIKIASLRVSDAGTVTTPAGDFADCRHVAMEISDSGSSRERGLHLYWFAPGVGIVRYERPLADGRTVVWQLTDYRGKGRRTAYFPIEDGLWRRYEPILSDRERADGWRGSLEYTFDCEEDADREEAILFRNTYGTQSRVGYEREAEN